MTEVKFSVAQLEEEARELTREALQGWEVPRDLLADLTLGTFFEGDEHVVFALYVAGERPEDAVFLTRARFSRATGEGEVEIFPEHLESGGERSS